MSNRNCGQVVLSRLFSSLRHFGWWCLPMRWCLIVGIGALLTLPTLRGGTWTPLTHAAPDNISLMLLLSDGTVMAANSGGNKWYQLTPDIHGSYVNGTWQSLATMHSTRLYFSSEVLPDGRLFVAGGEYGTGTNTAEVYDPVANAWTLTPAAGVNFYDSDSKVLPNGTVLVAPVFPGIYGGTLIYNPKSNSWSNGPTLFRGYYQDEASWVLLPDNSILTVDPFGTNSERFVPSLNQWINDANVPVSLYDPIGGELGAAFLLPNGQTFHIGGTSHTAMYTPSGSTVPGSWAAGPDIPGSLAAPDAPAAMMANGKILCTFSPQIYRDGQGNAVFPSPTSFYEYDPVTNGFTQINGPTGLTMNQPTYIGGMLDLPDGSVLYSTFAAQLYAYQPTGTPLAAGKPAISSILPNPDGSFHLVGTQLNGISEGAAYGDDNQMNSNYPLVRMTNAVGNVYYARTYNWSSTGVMTSNTPVSTDFSIPPSVPPDNYWLVVVANGIASDAVPFTLVPPALSIQPITGFAASGVPGGPFTVTSQVYTLTNAGSASLNWVLANTAPWLDATPSGGTLTPGGPATAVTVSLNASASNLLSGSYSATLWFTNLTDGSTVGRSFSLQIMPPNLVQNGGFETGSFASWTLVDSSLSTFVNGGSILAAHSGGDVAVLGATGGLGFLSQTLTTTPGQLYLLSLWLDSPDGLGPNEFLVEWNGVTNFDRVNIPALGWTNLQFLVTATSNSTILLFGFRDDPSYLGLDDVSVSPVPVPLLKIASGGGSSVTFNWTSAAGVLYQPQYKTNLTQANWSNLGPPMPGTGANLNFVDPIGLDPQRFYRVVLQP